MSKRAKYIGSHDAVVLQPWRVAAGTETVDDNEVPVSVLTGDDRTVEVEKGGLTPEDAPDHFIDGLLDQPANWVEFKAPGKSTPAEPESAASDAKE